MGERNGCPDCDEITTTAPPTNDVSRHQRLTVSRSERVPRSEH